MIILSIIIIIICIITGFILAGRSVTGILLRHVLPGLYSAQQTSFLNSDILFHLMQLYATSAYSRCWHIHKLNQLILKESVQSSIHAKPLAAIGKHTKSFLRLNWYLIFISVRNIIFFQVKDVQKKILQDRCLKKNICALRTSEPLPHDVSFRCRKCQVFVCQAHDVRRIQGSHHVIIDINVRNEKVLQLEIQ